jgi:dihydroneopterin aldolase
VRVHDVLATADALAVAARVKIVQEAVHASVERSAAGAVAPPDCSGSGEQQRVAVADATVPMTVTHDVRNSGEQHRAAVAGVTVAPTNTISITGLEAKGYHGVFPHERENGQSFVVDLEIEVAGVTDDDLSNTLNYATVCDEVVAIITGEPVNLIETLAGRIADAVLAHPQAQGVSVTVHKPQAPVAVPFGDIAVRTRRARHA